jgi:NAD+ diphosphatase
MRSIIGEAGPAGPTANVPYAGLGLDRASGRREDPAWVAALAADPRARFRPLWRDQCLAYARGVLRWNRHQRFCGRCGAAARPRHAGHLRQCSNDACGLLLFPRIEPAVITLVETVAPPRRCLLARHRASTTGGYSLLAGFVEIGESLEDAVRREIGEEAGVALRDVRYVGSQPWPFPAGIMAGFRATADESVSVDGNEIVEARWFTREQLRDYAETAAGLGRPDSIDRIMLTGWLGESVGLAG